MTTNMWVEQEWHDYKLKWDPEEYGGVTKLHVPADQIWLPDIVLYNNADGNYEVTIMTKAILHYDGTVVWKPPSIYKSACEIDVEYFPFDKQNCHMKFGAWTYDGYAVDLRHRTHTSDEPLIQTGIDLSEFYLSVEWDVMSVPAVRTEQYYSCCDTPYIDITFNITMRRKTLFYTVNLIIPCVLISALSVIVFYLPPDSGEKISLSISVVLSLGVFFLLLAEIIPPTSLAIPLLGRYLMFTLILVNFSVGVTILVINVNSRTPSTHKMPPWIRTTFLDILPRFLGMHRPTKESDNDSIKSRRSSSGASEKATIVLGSDKGRRLSEEDRISVSGSDSGDNGFVVPHPTVKDLKTMHVVSSSLPLPMNRNGSIRLLEHSSSLPAYHTTVTSNPIPIVVPVVVAGGAPSPDQLHEQRKAEIEHALLSVRFVAQHTKNLDNFCEIQDDWKYVALVLDRFFLWVFLVACIAGIVGIVLRAPTLYDDTQPIDIILSKVGRRMRNLPPIDS